MGPVESCSPPDLPNHDRLRGPNAKSCIVGEAIDRRLPQQVHADRPSRRKSRHVDRILQSGDSRAASIRRPTPFLPEMSLVMKI